MELLDYQGLREPRPPWPEAERAFTGHLTRILGRPLDPGELAWAVKVPYEFGIPWTDLNSRLVARLQTSW